MITEDGPSADQIDGASMEVTVKAIGWREEFKGSITEEPSRDPDKTLYAKVTGPEPTYPFTAICAIQSAITMIEEETKFEDGGVFTPGTAFKGTHIIDRLDKSGVHFRLLSSDY